MTNMDETKLALMHMLKRSVLNYTETWTIAEPTDDEDEYMHLFVFEIPTAFELLNVLGGLGVKFDVAYVTEDKLTNGAMLVSSEEPIEVEIRSIPSEVLKFKALG